MKTRDTIILLVVVVLVGLFIFIYERNLPSTGELNEREGRVLQELDPEKISRLSITAGSITTVIERVGETQEWKLSSPVEAEAEGAVVDGLISDLEFMSAERKVEKATGEQRKGFGLVEPTLTVEIAQQGDVFKFVVGSTSEAGGVYLALDGHDTVFVIDSASLESLRRDPWEFRQRRLLGRSGGEVTYMRVRAGLEPETVLEMKDDAWTVTLAGGAPERASRRAADKVMAALEGLKALSYLEDGIAEKDLASLGFGDDAPHVDFKREDGSGSTLVFGAPCEGEEAAVQAVLLSSGTLVCVGQVARDTILTPAPELRLTSPAEVDVFEVFSLEARRAGDVLVRLEKGDEGEWYLTAPGARRPADKDSVEAFLEALNKEKAPEIQPLPGDLVIAGLDPVDAVEIVILDVVGDEVASLHLGKNEKAEVTFRRKGEDGYGVIGEAPVLEAAAHPWTYLKRSVLRRDYFEAVRLELSGPVNHSIVKQEGSWMFESPTLAADSADVRDTVETFSALAALEFVADASADSLVLHGLTQPEWTVVVYYEGEDAPPPPPLPADGSTDAVVKAGTPVRLLIGKEAGDGRAAFLEGGDAVMVLSAQVVERLTRPLADKGAIAQAAADAASIVLTRKGQSETFSVSAGRVEAHTAGTQGLFALEDVRTFLEKLLTLRATAVLSYGAPAPKMKLAAPSLEVTLVPPDGDPAVDGRTVSFGAPLEWYGESLVHASCSTIQAVYGVDASLVESL
ncbi:MAG: DUF4340 domain-containing protein [Deltaproteobacteria bacterium]|nr:DUF4340 domain-containing protein [Deltaproteobacteria bacterium]